MLRRDPVVEDFFLHRSASDRKDAAAHPDNAFYGHRRILSEYAGLHPAEPPIWGHVQHGWHAEYALAARPRLVSWLPKLVFSDANVRAAKARGVEPVVAVGDPFCYAAGVVPTTSASGDSERSTIFYPMHGWERQDVVGSHDRLIAEISERERGAVTVCLYWREFDQRSVRRLYENAGFRVICHGYRNDPQFTLRQLDELQRHHRVAANRAATALWRGAHLGLEAEIYGPVFSIVGEDEGERYSSFQRSRWPDLCSGGVGGTAGQELAAQELGAPSVRAPGELRELLGWQGLRRQLARPAKMASLTEFHARRLLYNAALRLPGGGRLQTG